MMKYLKQEFLYIPYSKQKPILTFYIKFDFKELEEWNFCRVFYSKNLILRESVVDKNELESLNNFKIEGFLSIEHPKNIFVKLSAIYKEFVFGTIEEKKKFWEKVEVELLKKELKEFTSFDLLKNPLSVFNRFMFYPINLKVDIRRKDEKSFKIFIKDNRRGINKNYILRVYFFLNDDTLVDFKELTISRESKETVISTSLWQYLTLEILDEDSKNLLYRSNRVSFIEEISFGMSIIERELKTKLSTNQEIKMQSVGYEKTIISKEEQQREEYKNLKTYNYFNYLLREKLKRDREFIFIKENEKEKAYKLLEKLLRKSSSFYSYKLVFFDPYLGDFSKNDILDIVKLFSVNINTEKEFIFSTKKSGKNLGIIRSKTEKLKQEMSIDKLNLKIYATDKNFHDRFLFILENDAPKEAFLFGTSFNSLGENYSSIIELKGWELEEVYRNLFQFHKELIYEF